MWQGSLTKLDESTWMRTECTEIYKIKPPIDNRRDNSSELFFFFETNIGGEVVGEICNQQQILDPR